MKDSVLLEQLLASKSDEEKHKIVVARRKLKEKSELNNEVRSWASIVISVIALVVSMYVALFKS